MNYPGNELEIFDKATIWRKYIHLSKTYNSALSHVPPYLHENFEN